MKISRSREMTVLHPKPSACLKDEGYANADMDPVPFSRRTWTWYNVGGFWIAEGFQIPIMQMAGSLVTTGLSPGLTMGSIICGNVLVMVPCAMTGYLGAKTGLNYPIINRASWGMQGAKLAVAIRAIVAVFWYGVQNATGGQCVYLMLDAIWPSLSSRIPNRLPASSNTTSANLLCFFLFWLFSLPFLYIHVSKLRWLFLAKLIIAPLTGLALFIWAVVTGHGFGPVFNQPTNITTGNSVGFAFLTGLTAAIGPEATFALNMGDFCRFSKSPRATVWAQAFMMPICLSLTAFLGVTLASSSVVIYGLDKPEWNALNVIGMFQSRAARFFVSFIFAFATLCTNIAGNSVAFGNDSSSLLPKFLNIRSGQFLCAILGVCVTPWNIVNASGNFLNFLNGYVIFLGPIGGILMTDYWILRRRYLNLEQLFEPHGFYWYTHGWNLRAISAFLLALVPTLPGLAASVGSSSTASKVPQGFKDIYTLGWLVGLVVASALYYLFSSVFPISQASLSAGTASDIATEYLHDNLVIDGQTPRKSDAEEEIGKLGAGIVFAEKKVD